MRTRSKSYKDYGVSAADKAQVLSYCLNADKDEKSNIRLVLLEYARLEPYTANLIFENLTKGTSYEKMGYVAMSKVDFYGYRRKGIEAVKRYLLFCGKIK